MNLLQIACQNAHPEAVIWLMEQGLKPNQVSGYADLPLYQVATKGGSFGYVPRKGDVYRTTLALLDAGANALRRDGYGRYCFHRAAQNGNVEFLRAMAERGVRLGKTDRDGNTALHLIAESYYNPLEALERVKQEIEDKRNEASLPVKLRSPVSMEELEQRKSAIEQEMEDLFQCAVVLLEAGVDPEAENDMLCTAHAIAVRAGAKKLAALLDGSYDPQEDSPEKEKKVAAGGMTLHEAVRKSDAEAGRALVEMGADLNENSEQPSFEGLSPLAVACQTCNLPMATLLLELGADPTEKNAAGKPPIVALFGQQILLHGPKSLYRDRLAAQMVELLAEYGFDPDSSVNDQGDCLLGLACASDQRGTGRDSVAQMVVEAAIELGADVDRKNDAGQTPLMLSCMGDFTTMEEVQMALLEAGADVTLRDAQGNTVLHYIACKDARRDAVAMAAQMLDFGEPDANAVNLDGKTAMDYAVERDNAPLLLACQNQNVYLAEILLKAGADSNRKLLDGSSPLHYAAEAGNDPIARALLAGGADCNLRNLDGETPLILAAREGRNDMTALLIENGADVNLTDNLQFSALHYATENGFTEIVERLLMVSAEV